MAERPAQHQFQLGVDALGYYLRYPTKFIEDQLLVSEQTGKRMTAEQKLLVNAVFASKFGKLHNEAGKRRFGIAARSGHGVGKTAGVAMLICTWLYLMPTCKIPVTAPKKEQLSDNLWPEIAKLLNDSLLKEDFEWTKTKVFIKGEEQTRFCVPRTGSSPEALQGFHDDHLLMIAEEASGIEQSVFAPIEGTLTNEGAVLLLIGNPTKSSGYFYNAFRDDGFYKMHIPCIYPDGTLAPLVSAEVPERAAARYGKDSNYYRVRVLGEFPADDPDALIPREWVRAAMEREIPDDATYRVVWGLDVARFGDDRTVLCKRRGNKVIEALKSWSKKDGMQIAGLIQLEYNDTDEEMRPSEIIVDTIGLGAGPYDRMKELGMPVRSLNVAEMAAVRDRFRRRRDELWHTMRDWLETMAISLPLDEDLLEELSTPRYDTKSNGVIEVESKRDFKKRLGARSPDLAEALMLTFAGGLEKYEEHQRDRYKPKKKSLIRSWLAA